MVRNYFVKFRVSAEEKDRFEKLAQGVGVSLSELIRKRLDSVRIRPAEFEKERNRQIARIGNNLNQIARWVNVHKHGVEAVRVLAALEALRREVVGYSHEQGGKSVDN